MKDKLVVLGGSFNPPTLAHKQLLESVMDGVHADKGLYVPSSDTYVTRKAIRTHTPFIFSEQERYDMLKNLCNGQTEIDTCEYGDTTNGRTHTTLLEIQKKYPEHEICFIMGSDKLRILPKWRLSNMLSQFRIIVIRRNDDDPEKLITSNLKLAAYADSFTVLPKIQDFSEISSSKLQQLYLKKDFDRANQYVTDEIHEICMSHAKNY